MTEINHLPAHVLLVHAVVVLVLLAAIMTVVSAVWPAARRRLGVLTPIVAFVALGLVPVTTDAGEWLQEQLQKRMGQSNPLIARHVALGHSLLPWAAGMFLLAAVGWAQYRRLGSRFGTRAGRAVAGAQLLEARWLRVTVSALAVVVAVVSVVQVYRIGDSGAQAAWSGVLGK